MILTSNYLIWLTGVKPPSRSVFVPRTLMIFTDKLHSKTAEMTNATKSGEK